MFSSFLKRDDTLKLGDKAKDKVTGFSGTVIAITEWLNGCRRITIQPNTLHDGKPIEGHTFDAEQVEKVEESPAATVRPKGGPSISPQQRKDPC